MYRPDGGQVERMAAATQRTQLRRKSSRGRYDEESIHALIDSVPIAHVGVPRANGVLVLPMAIGRVEGALYLHGARSNGLLNALSSGVELCVEATIVDGLVLAKSALHHSMNYRSIVVFGSARVVTGEEKVRALRAVVDHVLPERSQETRASSTSESEATLVLAIELNEASVKQRSGPPVDQRSDLVLPHWSGVLPSRPRWGWPTDHTPEEELPMSVAQALLASAAPLSGELDTGAYVIHGDPRTLDLRRTLKWLRDEAYWSSDMTWNRLLRSLEGSLFVGAYKKGPQGLEHVGIGRVVTDRVTMAWLGDVFVAEADRGQGLGEAMVRFAVEHDELSGVRRWLLGTRDAHSLYAKFGFEPAPQGRLMAMRPNIAR